MADFIKFRFRTYDGSQATAGLIMDKDKFSAMSIEDISRCFPYSECMKMQMLEYSEPYGDWNSAFFHDFDSTSNPQGPYNVVGLVPTKAW